MILKNLLENIYIRQNISHSYNSLISYFFNKKSQIVHRVIKFPTISLYYKYSGKIHIKSQLSVFILLIDHYIKIKVSYLSQIIFSIL